MKQTCIPIFGRVDAGIAIVEKSSDPKFELTTVTIALPGLDWRTFFVDRAQAKAFIDALTEALADAPPPMEPPF